MTGWISLTLAFTLSLAAAPLRPQQRPKPAEPKPADTRVDEVEKSVTKSESMPVVTAGPSVLEERLNFEPTFQLRGRIEAEAVMAAQSAQSQATIGDLQNGYGFRRVRLGAQGKVGDAGSWVSEVELAGSNVRLRDVFIGLDALPGVQQVRVGHMREPYSLEGMTSSNFITFLERSPVNMLAVARNWGVCGYWWPDDQRVLFSLGVFRDGTPNTGQSIGDGDNWAYTTRLTGIPIYEPGGDVFQLVHLGWAFSQRSPPGGVVTFTPRTASNLLGVQDNPGSPFLPVVNISAHGYQLHNLQAAYVRGPFSLQGEWSAAVVQQTDAGTVFVHGLYVQGSYFLTGEHRGYNRTRGSFDQVEVLHPLIRDRSDPRGGWGAFEVVARYSHLNYDSPNLPLDVDGEIARTVLNQLDLGTNWYLNSHTRLMFNYTAGFPNKVGSARTVAHIFGIRAALYW
jgi:phosphate-selective porin OprO/OprP